MGAMNDFLTAKGKPGTRRVDHPLDWLFIPAAMLLFLTDVGLRRLAPARLR